MTETLDPLEHMFLGPVYRTRSAEVRADIDRLLGFEPGHRDSNKIVVAYCKADPETRARIDELLGLESGDGGDKRLR